MARKGSRVKQPQNNPPNQTLYITNLPDKVKKQVLRRHLYLSLTPYGEVLDVVALKTPKMRGQAHVAFRDIQTSTQAMRQLQGTKFLGKELIIAFAKGKSNYIARLDGTAKMPEPSKPKTATTDQRTATSGKGQAQGAKVDQRTDATKGVKRPAADAAENLPVLKKPREESGEQVAHENEGEGEDDESMEMEVSSDED